MHRWNYDIQHGIDVRKLMNLNYIPWPLFRFESYMLTSTAYSQGVGRHSEEEVQQVMEEDLQALSKFLGTYTCSLASRDRYPIKFSLKQVILQ